LDCCENHRFEVQANLWAKLKTFKKRNTSGIFFKAQALSAKPTSSLKAAMLTALQSSCGTQQ